MNPQSAVRQASLRDAAAVWPSSGTTEEPFDLYAWLRTEAPIYKRPGRDEFYVSRWEDLVAIAQQPEVFSNDLFGEPDPKLEGIRWRNTHEGGEFDEKDYENSGGLEGRTTPYPSGSSDPPEHKAKRRLSLTLVTRARLAEYEPMIKAHVNDLVGQWIARGRADFRSEFSDILPLRVIASVLGLPQEDVERFHYWGDTEAGGAARYVSEERAAIDAAKTREAGEYMRQAILDRYADPRDDYLSDLIRAQIKLDGEFDLDFLTAEGSLLLFAGNVTTSHMLANMMMRLSQNPEILERVSANPQTIPDVVVESLRYDSPVQWTQRKTKAEAVVNGVTIPAGSWVLMFWASGNRDESRFVDAAKWMPDREQVSKFQLGFGHGIHRCVGAPLAELEGKLAFEILLARMRDVRIDEAQADLRNIDSVRFRVPRRLPIIFIPRQEGAGDPPR